MGSMSDIHQLNRFAKTDTFKMHTDQLRDLLLNRKIIGVDFEHTGYTWQIVLEFDGEDGNDFLSFPVDGWNVDDIEVNYSDELHEVYEQECREEEAARRSRELRDKITDGMMGIAE